MGNGHLSTANHNNFKSWMHYLRCTRGIAIGLIKKVFRRSMKELLVSIVSEAQVSLETKIKYGDKKEICFIFTHAYGPLGGSFDHPVICYLFNYFAHHGYMTVKFNFRGVGNSTGKTSYTGSGEKQDLESVVNFVKRKSDLAPSHFILIGYSYGCIPIGALCADIPECIGIVAISYPAGVSWALTLWNSKKFAQAIGSISDKIPILFIMGDQDNFTSVSVLEKFVKSVSKTASINIISEMDHFWVGHEEALLGHINRWINTNINLKSFLKNDRESLSNSSKYSLAGKDGTSTGTLSSRMSLPHSEPRKESKSPVKRHSYDSQNYSKCQESIDVIENLRLHELIIADDKLKSSEVLKNDSISSSISKNAGPDSTLTLNSAVSVSAHALKSLERPKRPPPAIPAPRIASEPNL